MNQAARATVASQRQRCQSIVPTAIVKQFSRSAGATRVTIVGIFEKVVIGIPTLSTDGMYLNG
jgi:hypothetical protein